MTRRTFTLCLYLFSFLTFLTVTYQKIHGKTTGDLVIIDESLQDYRTLAAGLAPGSQVIYVSNSSEGFEKLSKQLASQGKAERVHIMTHGTDGNFVLGQTQLNGANIAEHERFWQSLGNVLVAGKSNLLLYSCQLTASRDGEGFVRRLHEMLGVPVAASNDQTGSERRGGDWDLEYVAGKIIKQHILKLLDFKGLLVPTFTQLTGGSSPFNAMTISTDNQLIYGDFDADGDIDIHLYPGGNVNQFWQNNGSGSFARVTGAADPFENINENAVFYSASNAFVADWDNDGDDDIYVPRRNGNTEKNFYYRNDNGKYVLLSGASSPFNGINVSGDNQLIFGDFDVDGDIDLHSYPGSQLDNEFWRNNGSGAFSKVTGTENPFDGLPGKAAFSSAQYAYVSDWDNDGDVDIFVSRIGGASVRDYYRNDNGVYSIQTGGANPFNGMTIASDNQIIFGDFDADGDIDLHTSDGSETLVFHRNNGSGVFTQVTGAGNPFNTLPNSGAFYNNALRSFVADWDNDGDVDVFTTNYTAANQKYFFRQNDAPPRITATSPANTATGISVSSDISFTFDRAVTGAAGKYIHIRRLFDDAVFATIEANSAQVTGSGSNTITINPATDLEGGRTYYVTIDKAAFVDTEGRIFKGVGNDATWLRFTTGIPAVAPTVTTASASEIALTNANAGGEVTADGGAAVTELGIVWSTSTAPTTESSNKVAIGSGTGAFSTTVTGLPAGTRIYLRAYAINSKGTSYGSEIDFYTQTSVTSITQQSSNPTNDGTVTYQVVFAQSVTIDDGSVFTLSTSGISGAAISGISGSGTTYDVTVNTGSGNGTLKLEASNLTSTIPNLNAAFTTATAYTIYKVSNAGDYYRSAATTGTWTTPGDWQSSEDNSFWITATSSPGVSAAGTLIASGHTMQIPNATDLSINNLTVNGVLYSGDAQLQINGSFANNGVVSGNAAFTGLAFTNSGTLAPGESPGTLAFTSDLNNEGTLLMEIGGTTAGTGYDQIQTGAFTAGGSMSVSFINGFTPALGDAFVLVDATSITGTFTTLNLPDIAPRVWETTYENGEFRIRAVNDPMPVTLIHFAALKNESAIDLVWSTSSEVNNSHFEIQRSAEGKVWENIGTVDRLEDNRAIRRYHFTDAMPLFAENFYRLRMIDTDGTFAFSKIEHVSFAGSKEHIKSYPNPVTDKIFLNVANAESIRSVEIYSASGVLHYTGAYTSRGIDVKAFPSGIFILRTTSVKREVSTFHFAKH